MLSKINSSHVDNFPSVDETIIVITGLIIAREKMYIKREKRFRLERRTLCISPFLSIIENRILNGETGS